MHLIFSTAVVIKEQMPETQIQLQQQRRHHHLLDEFGDLSRGFFYEDSRLGTFPQSKDRLRFFSSPTRSPLPASGGRCSASQCSHLDAMDPTSSVLAPTYSGFGGRDACCRGLSTTGSAAAKGFVWDRTLTMRSSCSSSGTSREKVPCVRDGGTARYFSLNRSRNDCPATAFHLPSIGDIPPVTGRPSTPLVDGEQGLTDRHLVSQSTASLKPLESLALFGGGGGGGAQRLISTAAGRTVDGRRSTYVEHEFPCY